MIGVCIVLVAVLGGHLLTHMEYARPADKEETEEEYTALKYEGDE